MSAAVHKKAVEALVEILGQESGDNDALDAIRYRFVRDRGIIAFMKYGAEVDRLVDAEMAKPVEKDIF